MYESATASGVIASWLTPSCLFIFLNLVIATIFIISRFGAPKTQIHHSPQLVRSPSFLDRVRSFNYHYQYYPTVQQTESPHPQLVRVPSLLERVKSFDFSLYKYQPPHPETDHVQTEPQYPSPNPDDNPQELQLTPAPSTMQRLQSIKVSHLYRSDSIHREEEPEPETEGPEPKTRKSASEDGEEEDEGTVEQWRPATARSEKTWLIEEEEEEGVDAKADDFINRFKKQLKLQRVDSILRYREMLK